jgi:hypothetical protein
MMIDLLFKLVLITSIWILGITIVTQPNMLLYSIRFNLTDEKGNPLRRIYEPLVLCHWCMPTFHSIIGYAFVWGMGYIGQWSWKLLLIYPLVVAGSSILCGIVWAIYQLLEESRGYFRSAEKNQYIQLKRKVINHKKQQHGNRKQIHSKVNAD